MDKYRVVEWAQISPHTSCCFAYVELTDAIEQAIVNDVRANGYFFGDEALFGGELQVCPVLNTGEAVLLSDDDCMELVCKAYGLSEEEYERYLHHVVKNPYIDLTTQKKYTCEYPIKRVVWINDDAFDDFKASILSGKSNVDIIPDDYIQLKKGDVVSTQAWTRASILRCKSKNLSPTTQTKYPIWQISKRWIRKAFWTCLQKIEVRAESIFCIDMTKKTGRIYARSSSVFTALGCCKIYPQQ